MNTSGYGGRNLSKQINVLTNDQETPSLALRITGDVEVVATITPSAVKLNGAPGADIHQEVTIVPSDRYPFIIKDFKAQKGEDLTAELTPPAPGKKEWKLTLVNTRTSLGRYYDVVTLETDSDVKPTIKVRVFGNIHNGELP